MASYFDTAQAACFDSQLAINGQTVTHGGTDYTAIFREKDEVYSDDFGGYVMKTTAEFLTADVPAEGVTLTVGSETFRVEGVVKSKPHSQRFALSQLT